MTEPPRTFVVVPCQPPVDTVYLDPAAVVTVEAGEDAEQRAAILAKRTILDDKPDCDRDFLGTMYVAEIGGYSVWVEAPNYERGEWECCGGNSVGGHSGYCPMHGGPPDG